MKKPTIFLFVAVLAAAVALMGCSGQGANANAPLIGIAMPETHVERWIGDGNRA